MNGNKEDDDNFSKVDEENDEDEGDQEIEFMYLMG
jgi:hypothetical protein